MPESILIVDDDPVQRRLLKGVVARMGFDPVVVAGGREALDLLDGRDGQRIRVMILDLIMPEMTGIEVLEAHTRRQRPVPVIVQTAQGGIETVVGAMRAGAFDFVVKPVSPERLHVSISNALKIDALAGEIRRLQSNVRGSLNFGDIISTGPAMERVLKTSEKAAKSHIPVLIEGESGVGKELIARAIQGSSDRRAKPFVTVNCGALPENLAESILFGHEKGSFTGASEKHIGKFREADGGTLFLDEIGELPLDIQVKLLRALQEGEIDPVGARKPVKIDIRLISATNRDLLADVKRGRFREDLYYRLSVLPLTVPPLRERREDIGVLAKHFMNRFAAEENRAHLRAIGPDALAMLSSYHWPGNIRQLENAVFRAVVLAEGDMLTVEEFPQIAAQTKGFDLPAPAAQAGGRTRQDDFDIAEREQDRHAPAKRSPVPEFGLVPLTTRSGQVRSLEEIEAEAIRFAIQIYRGRMSEVARRLGIGRSTLYRKLKDYDLVGRSDRFDAA